MDIGELRDLGIAERGPMFGEFADESKIVEIEPQFGVESRDRGREEIAMPFGVLFEPAERPGCCPAASSRYGAAPAWSCSQARQSRNPLERDGNAASAPSSSSSVRQ